MVLIKAQDPVLGNTAESYTSPFPSSDTLANDKFASLLATVGVQAGSAEGILSQLQAEAWDRANRVLMRRRFMSPFAGGIRSDWLPYVASVVRSGGFDLVRGLFSDPAYPASASSASLEGAAVEAGLTTAQNTLSAVPTVGKILKAGIGVAKFMWRLANRGEEEQVLEVPWQQYSRATDEDAVNLLVAPMMDGTDWTPLFMPALAAGDFRMEKTERGGPTRAFGVWRPNGKPEYQGGVGMMPGTQKMTDVIQVANVHLGTTARRDAVTDVGSFWPSVSQFSTGAWGMVQRAGNPDMYKLRAGDLADAWTAYFDALFEGGFAQYEALGVNDWDDKIFLSKLLSPFVVAIPATGNRQLGLNVDELEGPYVTPEIFSSEFKGFSPTTRYGRPDDEFILPATRALKESQKSMLARSLVCALVRPVAVAGMPAFGAFDDQSAPLSPGFSTFGEELRDYCLEMRARLLTHPERYKLAQRRPGSVTFERWAPDVMAVDPLFAAQLEATFTQAIGLKATGVLGLAVRPLVPDAPPPGPDIAPLGGPPFPPGDTRGWFGRWWGALVAGGLVAAGVGTAAWEGSR